MSDQDVFGSTASQTTTTTSQTTETVPPADPFKEKLDQITNEDGQPKYKDVPTALEALANSQRFIPTLLAEKQQLQLELEETQRKLQEMGNVEDLLARYNNASTSQEPPKTNPAAQTAVSEETLTNIVQQAIDAREADRLRNDNLQSVIGAVVKALGDTDKAASHIKTRSAELGISTDDLRSLSQNTPKVALELLIGKPNKTAVAPSQSSIIPPISPQNDNEYPTYERGVARGGMSNKELAARWRESAKYTNKRIGLETS